MKKIYMKIGTLVATTLPIAIVVSCGSDNSKTTEATKPTKPSNTTPPSNTNPQTADVQQVVDDLKALGTKMLERSEAEFDAEVISLKTADRNDFLNLGLNNLFTIPTSPPGLKIEIEKKAGKDVSFKVSSTATTKSIDFNVTFSVFTDIRGIVHDLNSLQTTTLSEAVFENKTITGGNTSVLATVLADLGITYQVPTSPPGLKIEVNKKLGEKKVAYFVRSALDSKGQRPLVTFKTFT